jgi:hypothetical protein
MRWDIMLQTPKRRKIKLQEILCSKKFVACCGVDAVREVFKKNYSPKFHYIRRDVDDVTFLINFFFIVA